MLIDTAVLNKLPVGGRFIREDVGTEYEEVRENGKLVDLKPIQVPAMVWLFKDESGVRKALFSQKGDYLGDIL